MSNPIGGLLAGKGVVVTGAGAGIGAAIAERFAAEGGHVLVVDSNRDDAGRSVDSIKRSGGVARSCVADVREVASVEAILEAARGLDRSIDVLVNNVGDYRPAGLFAGSSEADWQALYAVNLLHVFRLTHAFLPGMTERKAGSIVNVSSVEAFRGIPAGAVYSAFKAGVNQFTRSLAVEVGGLGVRVNAIAPDVTQTPQLPYDRWVSEEERSLIPSWVPVGRFGKPEDVAAVALFLASDEARFVTGHTLPVDGGTLAASGWYKRVGKQSWTNRPRNP
ncbi:MAG: SDR family oxidoreductase [Acidobacteria bacterium]|nr:MAG: SDR family oxidoreductase [Acidobacteriota bacterium]TDJ16119.1 MAG: SDR family oxidoreductase [Deltaproteobacteria bacterium]TDJ21138.1 MAG: SDR family oxidoreductase [Deltaproteobacteria bacterium]